MTTKTADRSQTPRLTIHDVATRAGCSRAVSVGLAVLDALDAAHPNGLILDGNDLDEVQCAEMVAYLKRRGVTVNYDAGFPVAQPASQGDAA